MTAPAGFSIAFDDDALTDNPAWTRVDNHTGIMVESITIDRGRPDERSKTSPGTVTVSGYDTVGALDPTNATGPWYGKLDPTKQAAVAIPNPATSTWKYAFKGHTAEFIWDLDVSEKFAKFEIQLVDVLDLLNDAEVIPDNAGNLAPGENIGDCYYTGQHCDDRLMAVLADTATAYFGQIWPIDMLEIASGNVFVQGTGYGRNTSMLQVIDEACDAEGPSSTNRFAAKDGPFRFTGRYYRYTPDNFSAASDETRRPNHRLVKWGVGDLPAFASDSSLAVASRLKIQRGKENLINVALCTPQGIPTSKIGAQIQHDAVSYGRYGVRTGGMSLENLKMSDGDDGNDYIDEAKSYGEAIVGNYAYPVDRVPQIAFKNPPRDDVDRWTNTWALMTGIELSDLVTVHSQHPGGGGLPGVDQFVEKIHYDITALQGDEWMVTLTLDLSPRAYYTFKPRSWKVPAATAPQADFTWAQSGGLGSATVNFTDASTAGSSGPITSRLWTFGDGTTSTSASPTHAFPSTGLWGVTLAVTGTSPDGTDSTFQGVILA